MAKKILSYLLMNENKRINNTEWKSHNVLVLRLNMKKMRWNITKKKKTNKQTMGVIFTKRNSRFWLDPYWQKKSLRYTAKIDL